MLNNNNWRRARLNPISTVPAWLLALALAFTSSTAAAQDEAPELSFDNLVPIQSARAAVAYIDPDADFSVFRRVAILEPYVAFRSNWQRDQNRARRGRISNRDMKRMKQDAATIFERAFTERLEAAGYEVVDTVGDDVLLLRPAIIDLDIAAPDTRSPGRSRTYTAMSGAATLYVQLIDSVTGEVLGRAADRRVARRAGNFFTWSNTVTNRADAARTMGQWADTLVDFLNSHYMPGSPETNEGE